MNGGSTEEQPPVEQPAPDPVDAPPPVQPVEKEPFWGYLDLGLFAVLAIPCMFVGAFVARSLVRALVALFAVHSRIPALEPLAEQLGGDIVLFAALALVLRLQYERPFWHSLGWRAARVPFLWAVIAGLACALGVAVLGSLIHIPTTNNPM